MVQNTPYKLVQDIRGIGFKTADRVAQALGLSADDPDRIEAGVAYTLNRMAEEGHVYVPQEILEPEAAEILTLPAEKVSTVIDQLETDALLKRETITYQIGEAAQPQIREEKAVYLTPMYYSEIGVTNRVRRLIEHPTSRLAGLTWRPTVPTQMRVSLKLSQQQQTCYPNRYRQQGDDFDWGSRHGKKRLHYGRCSIFWIVPAKVTCSLPLPDGPPNVNRRRRVDQLKRFIACWNFSRAQDLGGMRKTR